jgi:hypothetical protein
MNFTDRQVLEESALDDAPALHFPLAKRSLKA